MTPKEHFWILQRKENNHIVNSWPWWMGLVVMHALREIVCWIQYHATLSRNFLSKNFHVWFKRHLSYGFACLRTRRYGKVFLFSNGDIICVLCVLCHATPNIYTSQRAVKWHRVSRQHINNVESTRPNLAEYIKLERSIHFQETYCFARRAYKWLDDFDDIARLWI